MSSMSTGLPRAGRAPGEIAEVVNKIASVAVVIAIAINFIWILKRFPYDSNEWLNGGMELVRGRLPYRDFYMQKPPGLAYLLYAAFALVGPKPLVPHALVFLCNLTAAYLVSGIASQIRSKSTGVLAAALFLLSIPVYRGTLIFTEPFYVLSAISAVWLEVVQTDSWIKGACIGLCLFAAFMFKQHAGIYAGAFLIYWSYLYRMNGLSIPKAVAAGITFATCGVLAILLMWHSGILDGFFDQALLMNFHEYSFNDSSRYGLKPFSIEFIELILYSPLVWALWVGSITSLRSPDARGSRGQSGPIVLLHILSATGIMPALLFCPIYHYMLIPLPFVCVLAAEFFERAVVPANKPAQTAAVAAILMLPLAGRLAAGTFRLFYLPEALVQAVRRVPFLGAVSSGARANLLDDLAVAREIARHTSADKEIIVYPAGPGYYFLADRKPFDGLPYYYGINKYAYAGNLEKRIAEKSPGGVVVIRHEEHERYPIDVFLEKQFPSKLVLPGTGSLHAEADLYYR